MSIYAKPTSAEDYKSGIPRRLEANKLTDDHLYYLMMSAHGKGPEAYLAPVFLKDITHDMGKVAVNVFFTDIDLNPLAKPLHSVIDSNFWIPDLILPLHGPNVDSETEEGYFIAYEEDLGDSMLKMMDDLSVMADARL